MFPRYFRWTAGIGAFAGLVSMVLIGLKMFYGAASATDLIRPIICVILFGWMFTQSTKA
ncbi:hypothetical protein ACIOWE_16075 [Pseudomonas sp. NPDC087598]|uniref:hypothetical protein n=1 Tax=Pseudomonas sp. NPDC087598 TaxID=3364440 RepID=UPI00382950B0